MTLAGLFTIKAYLDRIADRRMRTVIAASVMVLIMAAMHFSRLFLPEAPGAGIHGQDYPAFYAAARAALSGVSANLYDPAVFQQAVGAETPLLWLYPPPMLFALAPFGLLPYGAAKLLFVAISLTAAYAIGRLATGSRIVGALTAISPAGFATLFVGQVSAVFGLLIVAGVLLAKRHPLIAGACFALLTVKAQYGLLVIPFLILERAWKALGAASFFTIVLVIASASVFGVDMWRDFFQSLVNGVHAAYYDSGGHAGRITASDAIKAAGFAAPSAALLYGLLFVIAVIGMARLRQAPAPLRAAFFLAASAVICPYLFVYDYFIFSGAVLLIAANRKEIEPLHVYALAGLWFAPLVPFIAGSPLTPAFLWPATVVGVIVIYVIARNAAPRNTALQDAHALA
ncbi:MAG: glycosyltransferase family 87 protein [Pseudomonadota bacterium]